jgi:TonB-dependent SusC/RagA subfamily outer membrane receptor
MIRIGSRAGARTALASLALAAAACRAPAAGEPPAPAGDAAAAAADSAAAARGAAPTTATEKEWRDRAVGQAEELFVGRFAGVRVLRLPDGSLTIRLRGASSIHGSGEPLYVIDGVPVPAGTSGLVGINPADIARIEVLKDAASTTFYGVRGANGVVLITTKRPPR